MEHFVDTVLILKPMELSSCTDYNGKLIIGKLASFNTFLYETICRFGLQNSQEKNYALR